MGRRSEPGDGLISLITAGLIFIGLVPEGCRGGTGFNNRWGGGPDGERCGDATGLPWRLPEAGRSPICAGLRWLGAGRTPRKPGGLRGPEVPGGALESDQPGFLSKSDLFLVVCPWASGHTFLSLSSLVCEMVVITRFPSGVGRFNKAERARSGYSAWRSRHSSRMPESLDVTAWGGIPCIS